MTTWEVHAGWGDDAKACYRRLSERRAVRVFQRMIADHHSSHGEIVKRSDGSLPRVDFEDGWAVMVVESWR